MAISANFAATPRIGAAVASAANTNRDGTGTIVSVFAAGANGSRIDSIIIQATGTTTAGMVRLYLHDGTTARLYDEVPVTAVTPGSAAPAWSAALGNNAPLATGRYPLWLPNGWSLRAAPHNAESFNVIAVGGDF